MRSVQVLLPGCIRFHLRNPGSLGFRSTVKPLLHLHTQFNREIPYDTIDMDFMNENQSAHGDREYGHIFTRLGMERKVIMAIGPTTTYRNGSVPGCVQQ